MADFGDIAPPIFTFKTLPWKLLEDEERPYRPANAAITGDVCSMENWIKVDRYYV